MYADALGYLREIDARPEIARCLAGLGRVALDLGDLAAARAYLTESLRLSRDIGTRIGMARGLESCAALADPRRRRRARGDADGRVGRAARRPPACARRPGPAPTATWPPPTASTRARPPGCGRAGWRCPPRPPSTWPSSQACGTAAAQRARRHAGREPAAPRRRSTPRELEIAALIADGRSNKAIAAELVISPATVARHVANIMTKLDFRSRAAIAAWITGSHQPGTASLRQAG